MTYDETDGGYGSIMSTRPDTIAAALVDSPVGLALRPGPNRHGKAGRADDGDGRGPR
jgi:hypothetical protein